MLRTEVGEILSRSFLDEVLMNINSLDFIKKISDILDPNARIFKRGFTLMHLSLFSIHVEIPAYLLQKGGNPNILDAYGINPTELAILLKKEKAFINLLREYGGVYKDFLLLDL
jgi:ankyrin repeat protein